MTLRLIPVIRHFNKLMRLVVYSILFTVVLINQKNDEAVDKSLCFGSHHTKGASPYYFGRGRFYFRAHHLRIGERMMVKEDNLLCRITVTDLRDCVGTSVSRYVIPLDSMIGFHQCRIRYLVRGVFFTCHHTIGYGSNFYYLVIKSASDRG